MTQTYLAQPKADWPQTWPCLALSPALLSPTKPFSRKPCSILAPQLQPCDAHGAKSNFCWARPGADLVRSWARLNIKCNVRIPKKASNNGNTTWNIARPLGNRVRLGACQVAPCWNQVGPKLEPSGSKLEVLLAKVDPMLSVDMTCGWKR